MAKLIYQILSKCILQVQKFMARHCPRGKRSCIGRYKRNVISFRQEFNLNYCETVLSNYTFIVKFSYLDFLSHAKHSLFCCRQTVFWLLFWEVSGLADFVLETIFMTYKHALPATTIFHIWNLKGLITNEGLHMLIPWTLNISDEQTTSKQVEFYVRKPTVLIPRSQYSIKDSSSQKRKIVVKECKTEESADTSQSHDMKLLQGKYCISGGLSLIEGNLSTPEKLDVFDTIRGGQNNSNISTRNICNKNELKLSIPNLLEQGHFDTIVYCRCHKKSKVVSS